MTGWKREQERLNPIRTGVNKDQGVIPYPVPSNVDVDAVVASLPPPTDTELLRYTLFSILKLIDVLTPGIKGPAIASEFKDYYANAIVIFDDALVIKVSEREGRTRAVVSNTHPTQAVYIVEYDSVAPLHVSGASDVIGLRIAGLTHELITGSGPFGLYIPAGGTIPVTVIVWEEMT